jgi:hypothetical protein
MKMAFLLPSRQRRSGYFSDQKMRREIQNPQMFKTDPESSSPEIYFIIIIFNLHFSISFKGLIAWNFVAAVASFGALLTWIIQYFFKLRQNVLVREDKSKGGWTSAGMANIGHSFWLVVVALVMYGLNVLILHFLRSKRKRHQSSKRAIVEATTKPNGNLMLY